jgi:YD repeat-containing protein
VLAGAAALPLMSASRANAAVVTPIGAWQEVVSIPQGQTIAQIVFGGDGTVVCTSDGRPLPISQFQSCRVGLWRPTGTRTFEFFFSEYTYDANGVWTGWRRPHGHATLASDGKTYTETATVGMLDTNGTLLGTFPAHGTATRIPFPPF